MVPAAIRHIAAVLALCLGLASQAAAEACRSESFEGEDYIVCSFDAVGADMRVFWRGGDGEPYRTFAALAEELRGQGKSLAFAMNGGMYDDAYAPVGLYVEKGVEEKPANTADADGNFHMKPNGVFYIGEEDAGVMETEAFLTSRPPADFATQSGPMLVIDGKIHPRFIPGSEFIKRRNGVGVSGGTVHFAISEGSVNFDEFARLFRDRLGCDSALFLDGGSAPGLYAPEMNRNDAWRSFGPIVGVVE
ncbi:MAG TPA: phosphodiester glycosidase family protein [Propylenella sp.]